VSRPDQLLTHRFGLSTLRQRSASPACLARTPEKRKNSHWFGGSYGESRPKGQWQHRATVDVVPKSPFNNRQSSIYAPAIAPRCVGRRCGRKVLAMLCLSTRRDAIFGVCLFVVLSVFTSIALADPKCPAGKHWLRGACRPMPTSSTQAIQCISDCNRLFRNHSYIKARARYIRQCQHDCTHL
jgi:hypothetical protein